MGGKMSKTEDTVTSSSKRKRGYRKGNPMPPKERQKASIARRSSTHKAFHAVIQANLKTSSESLLTKKALLRQKCLKN
ncbi:RepB family protein [Salmonella enterica]|uniref:RepB family protein n=1 Tax=Salmonella enterica TaxID=28901 RepID=UPI00352AC6CF